MCQKVLFFLKGKLGVYLEEHTLVVGLICRLNL